MDLENFSLYDFLVYMVMYGYHFFSVGERLQGMFSLPTEGP